MIVTVYLVDAFTKQTGKGNRAGVVLEADTLTTEQMQEIARLVNVSETAFIRSSTDAGHDLQVRYFTPAKEVPICGHATIAAHYQRASVLSLSNCKLLSKTGAGILPVEIIKKENDYSIVMTQGKPTLEPPLSPVMQEKILTAL